jgi:hypothetical protein
MNPNVSVEAVHRLLIDVLDDEKRRSYPPYLIPSIQAADHLELELRRLGAEVEVDRSDMWPEITVTLPRVWSDEQRAQIETLKAVASENNIMLHIKQMNPPNDGGTQ